MNSLTFCSRTAVFGFPIQLILMTVLIRFVKRPMSVISNKILTFMLKNIFWYKRRCERNVSAQFPSWNRMKTERLFGVLEEERIMVLSASQGGQIFISFGHSKQTIAGESAWVLILLANHLMRLEASTMFRPLLFNVLRTKNTCWANRLNGAGKKSGGSQKKMERRRSFLFQLKAWSLWSLATDAWILIEKKFVWSSVNGATNRNMLKSRQIGSVTIFG